MDYGFTQAQLSLRAILLKLLSRTVRRGRTQRLICSDSYGLSFGDINSYWQTFLCCHFSQPVFKSVIFFLWIPKLGRKAVKGCILTSKTGVSSVKFVTPIIRRLMRLSDFITPGFPWLPCFYGYDDGDFLWVTSQPGFPWLPWLQGLHSHHANTKVKLVEFWDVFPKCIMFFTNV